MTQKNLAEVNIQLPGLPVAKLALWLLLAVATMLFAMLLSAYLVRLGLTEEHTLPKPILLWFNTLLLAFSSFALEWARRSRGERPGAPTLWFLGGALAVLFLAGQIFAWRELAQSGYFLATNPASSFFYLLTAIHGLHLLGGLIAWMQTAGCIIREGQSSPPSPLPSAMGEGMERRRLKIELCVFYWHFLLAIWMVILGLIWATT